MYKSARFFLFILSQCNKFLVDLDYEDSAKPTIFNLPF